MRARVFRSATAEPASGSDIDTATTSSPRQTAGSTLRRSASGAKCSIARAGPTELSKTGNAIAGETFANSHPGIALHPGRRERLAGRLDLARDRRHLLGREAARRGLQRGLLGTQR